MLWSTVQGSSQISSASLPLWVVWAQSGGNGVRHVGAEHQGSSSFMELTCWPRSFPVGKVCPSSCGYRTFPRHLPVRYSACQTVTWPDSPNSPRIPVPKLPMKSLAGGLWVFLPMRAEVTYDSAWNLSLMCSVFCKSSDSAGQSCFLRMRKCNKARSSPALQQSGRCSTASILSPVLPMGAVPILSHLCSPTVLRNPTPAPKFFAWHRTFKANRTSKCLSVFSFLLSVLCCLQCPPTLSFSVPTA